MRILGTLFIALFLAACSGADSAEAPKPISQTLEAQAWQMIKGGAIVLDVRTPGEFSVGHIDGAVNIPYTDLRQRRSELGDDTERGVVLYCRTGHRARIAEKTLHSLGFEKTLNAKSYTALERGKP